MICKCQRLRGKFHIHIKCITKPKILQCSYYIYTLFPSWCSYCNINSVYATPWSVSDTLKLNQSCNISSDCFITVSQFSHPDVRDRL